VATSAKAAPKGCERSAANLWWPVGGTQGEVFRNPLQLTPGSGSFAAYAPHRGGHDRTSGGSDHVIPMRIYTEARRGPGRAEAAPKDVQQLGGAAHSEEGGARTRWDKSVPDLCSHVRRARGARHRPHGTSSTTRAKRSGRPKGRPGPQRLLLGFGHVRPAAVRVVLEPDPRLVLLDDPKPLQLRGDDPHCRESALREPNFRAGANFGFTAF
jgi:hypothetical protein